MTRPTAVVIGDIHFTVPTLELATSSVKQARDKAFSLGVPLILNGDTLDSKAIVRGECANRLIETLTDPNLKPRETIVNIGNHDLLSERSSEHSLNFLRPFVTLVDGIVFHENIRAFIIPYCPSTEYLKNLLDSLPTGSTVICHQGVRDSSGGHYILDKTALDRNSFSRFRTIASHYHQRQDIECRDNAIRDSEILNNIGMFSYIGNPYTLSFGEANDGPKGFCVLYEDGSLEQVPTNLRRHVIFEKDYTTGETNLAPCNPGDRIWLKLKGARSTLDILSKEEIGNLLWGHSNYKLEKIYTDQPQLEVKTESMTAAEIYDSIINSTGESPEQVARLKALWREVLSG